MCGGFIEDVVKPISDPLKKATGGTTSKSRREEGEQVVAARQADKVSTKKKKLKIQSTTRKQQIEKFGANVAAGAAKRAASTGR